LHRFGIRLWRRNVGGLRDRYGHHVRFAAPGQSDLWGVMPRTAKHIEIEVKRDGEKPTPKQLAWLRQMHELGCIAMWTDNCNDAERCFEAIMNGARVVWNDRDFWLEPTP
jgi:hypothetical protein